MSDPDFIDVLTEAIDTAGDIVQRSDIRAALRALVAYRQDPPAATKMWVEQRLASVFAERGKTVIKLHCTACGEAWTDDHADACRGLGNPSEPPKSSPSEWAQARQRLRDASTLVQITEFGNPSFPLRLNGLTDAADAILALGDPAPAAVPSELPLLRELLGFLYGYYAVGEAIALKGAMQAQIKGLIARASAQAGGGA